MPDARLIDTGQKAAEADGFGGWRQQMTGRVAETGARQRDGTEPQELSSGSPQGCSTDMSLTFSDDRSLRASSRRLHVI
jgi:hypothetical protein